MATSTKHSGFKRLVDRINSSTLGSNFATTDSELAILVNGQEVMGFKPDSVGTFALAKTGNQPAEALASIIDGYGVSLATGYSASASNRIYALEINADTGSTDLAGDTNLGAIKGRVVAGTTQTSCGISGIIGTLDVFTVDLQGNFNGVCGVLDFYGDCTLGTGATCYGAGLVSVVWNEATTTLGGGAVLSGIDLIENGAVGAFGSGALNPAVNVRGNWQQVMVAGTSTTPMVATAGKAAVMIYNDFATSASTGGSAEGLYVHQYVSPKVDVTASAFVFGIHSRLEIQGGATTSVTSQSAAIRAYYMTDGTSSVSLDGSCSTIYAECRIGANTTFASTGYLAALAINSRTVNAAVFDGEQQYWGIIMGRTSASYQKFYAAMRITDCTYLLDIRDDDVMADDDDTGTGGTKSGWLRLRFREQGVDRYIRLYTTGS